MFDAYSLPSPTTRKAQQAKKRRKTGLLFFYNGTPYRFRRKNTGLDALIAFNFVTQEENVLSYTDVSLRMERVWRTGEVERILNRSFVSFYRAWNNGLEKPFKAEYKDKPDSKVGLLWHEEDIFRMHEYLANNPRGRPRKDGKSIPTDNTLPSRAEVRARLKGQDTTYVKNATGDYVPTWKANQFGI